MNCDTPANEHLRLPFELQEFTEDGCQFRIGWQIGSVLDLWAWYPDGYEVVADEDGSTETAMSLTSKVRYWEVCEISEYKFKELYIYNHVPGCPLYGQKRLRQIKASVRMVCGCPETPVLDSNPRKPLPSSVRELYSDRGARGPLHPGVPRKHRVVSYSDVWVDAPIYTEFYHVTTAENWVLIQESGHLWGNLKDPTYRYTYVAPTKALALRYVGWTLSPSNRYTLLKVKYLPTGRTPEGYPTDRDNYDFRIPEDCEIQQLRIYVPIPLSDVEVVEEFQYGHLDMKGKGRFI